MAALTFRVLLWALLLAASVSAHSQPLMWVDNLEAARSAAAREKKPLLILFTAPEAGVAAKMEMSLESPALRSEVDDFILLRLDMTKHVELAASLGVFRAGTVLLYGHDGKGLGRLTDQKTEKDLVRSIRLALGKADIIGVPAVAGKATLPTSGAATKLPLMAPAQPPLPKGSQIGSTINKMAIDGKPARLGKLEKGKHYVLVIEGQCSVWPNTKDTMDAFYIYMHPTAPGKVMLNSLVRDYDTGTSLSDYLKHAGPLPPLNDKHRYEFLLPGNDRELNLFIHEKDALGYRDNSGFLRFSLYEAP